MGSRARVRALLVGPDPPRDAPPGVEVVWVPLVEARPIPGSSRRALAAAREHGVDSVVFTSPRAPRALMSDAVVSGVAEGLLTVLSGLDAWAIGPRTAEAVSEHLGLVPRTPSEYRGRALGREIAESGARCVLGLRGTRVVPDLEESLRSRGVEYFEVKVYELRPLEASRERLRLELGRVDAVILTSPFIARLFFRAADALPSGVKLVAIGPTTASAVELLGGSVYCYPREYTVRAALECVLEG